MLKVLGVDIKPIRIKHHHPGTARMDYSVSPEGSQAPDVKSEVTAIASYRNLVKPLTVKGDDGFVFLFPCNHVISIPCRIH